MAHFSVIQPAYHTASIGHQDKYHFVVFVAYAHNDDKQKPLDTTATAPHTCCLYDYYIVVFLAYAHNIHEPTHSKPGRRDQALAPTSITAILHP